MMRASPYPSLLSSKARHGLFLWSWVVLLLLPPLSRGPVDVLWCSDYDEGSRLELGERDRMLSRARQKDWELRMERWRDCMHYLDGRRTNRILWERQEALKKQLVSWPPTYTIRAVRWGRREDFIQRVRGEGGLQPGVGGMSSSRGWGRTSSRGWFSSRISNGGLGCFTAIPHTPF